MFQRIKLWRLIRTFFSRLKKFTFALFRDEMFWWNSEKCILFENSYVLIFNDFSVRDDLE